MSAPVERKAIAPHWYFIAVFECQLCSHADVYRERRFEPRPEKWDDRHEWRAVACSSHFM